MKLNEGEIHSFQVLKRVQIPEEGDFFMLRHVSGRRLLLPYETYKNFGIELGQSISCRIDKVSCTGKVYLEPKHPIYMEGVEYNFNFIEFISTNERLFMIVQDCYRNRVKVPLANKIPNPSNSIVGLIVNKIKKGIPILSYPYPLEISNALNSLVGGKMIFLVKEVFQNSYNEDVFFLISQDNKSAEIKVKHFSSYEIKVGDNIECEIIGITHDGFLKVEPHNPFYNLGEIYDFKIVDILSDAQNDGIGESTIVVEDIYGKKCGVVVNKGHLQDIKKTTRLECRVIGFRKGRPKLEIVDQLSK